MRRLVTVLLLTLLVPAAAAHAVTAKPFGALDCAAQEGVRLCQGQVATFDDVPLDTNVTLPATGDGPFPLVILSHGWGGEKYPLVNPDDRGDLMGSSLPWAQRGYAVLSVTSRGFNGSCGTPQNRVALGCDHGWLRLDDTRYEIRDVQFLAGRLVDDGLVDPRRIGVHGGSYGGGVSNALAVLRNRIMQPDGSYAPWTSPKGTPLELAAAAPYIPWSDLVYALTPNGRTLDHVVPRTDDSRRPAGVEKASFVSGLYALGNTTGFYSPPGADADADLTRWFAQIGAGEPYDGNPAIEELADEIYSHHSSISLDQGVAPAPLFIASGFTDDLFPADEALRLRNQVAARWPETPIALMFFDFGHQRGANKKADVKRYQGKVLAWMDRYVKGDASAPAPAGVETLTQTCPHDAPSGGPYDAPSWQAIHPGEVRLTTKEPLAVTSAGGDPSVGRAIDPIAGGGDACAQVADDDEAGTVNLRLPKVTGGGYTLMGSPTVIADLTTTGAFPQLDARLWDVGTDGKQTLVARTVYRPDPGGVQVFQLHPNGYRFAAGHEVKLQLLGRDAPYARPSNGQFTIDVEGLELRLPVAERPGANPAVRDPLPLPLPRGAQLAPGFGPATQALPARGAGASAQPRRTRRTRRLTLVVGCHGARLAGPDVGKVKRLTVYRSGMRRRTDRHRPFRVALTGKGRRVRALAVLRDGRSVGFSGRLPRRC